MENKRYTYLEFNINDIMKNIHKMVINIVII